MHGFHAAYPAGAGHLAVVRGLSFDLHAGEVVGLLGESGCGKTTAALAMLGLMPPGSALRGSVRFKNHELLGAAESTLQRIRGAQISLIAQEPSLSLNPVLRVIGQVAQVVRAHQRASAAKCREQPRAALAQAGLDTERLQQSYPHQLSGGQRQRILIAQAIVCRPALVIADEPAAALDTAAAQEGLALLRGLVRQSGASLLLITHDPSMLASWADRVLVMYAGRLVESGPASEVLETPRHPYTQGLLRCLLDAPDRRTEPRGDRHVPAIEGAPPDFHRLPPGCTFEPRCPDRMRQCRQAEPALWGPGARQVSCFLYEPRH